MPGVSFSLLINSLSAAAAIPLTTTGGNTGDGNRGIIRVNNEGVSIRGDAQRVALGEKERALNREGEQGNNRNDQNGTNKVILSIQQHERPPEISWKPLGVGAQCKQRSARTHQELQLFFREVWPNLVDKIAEGTGQCLI